MKIERKWVIEGLNTDVEYRLGPFIFIRNAKWCCIRSSMRLEEAIRCMKRFQEASPSGTYRIRKTWSKEIIPECAL